MNREHDLFKRICSNRRRQEVTARVVAALGKLGLLVQVDPGEPGECDVLQVAGHRRYVLIESSGLVSLCLEFEYGGDADSESFFLSSDPHEEDQQIRTIDAWLCGS